jgi:hypothetical protein
VDVPAAPPPYPGSAQVSWGRLPSLNGRYDYC